MDRLRKELDILGVEWTDHSDKRNFDRTRFVSPVIGKTISVIYGPGSYGYHNGMLEAWIYNSKAEPQAMTVNEILDEYVIKHHE